MNRNQITGSFGLTRGSISFLRIIQNQKWDIFKLPASLDWIIFMPEPGSVSPIK